MPKFIDKMNLPQYRYFHDMAEKEKERQEIVSDALAGEHTMRYTDKRDRIAGMRMFNRAVRRIPEFLYRLEEDQERCRNELAVSDLKQKQRRLDGYLDMILALPVYQGKVVEKKQFISREMQETGDTRQPVRKYKVDKETGRPYLPYTSVPKLLLINEELFQEKGEAVFTEEDKKRLESLMTRDVHYIICVQGEGQSESAYLVGMEDGETAIQKLERRRCSRKVSLDRLLLKQNDLTGVLLCLQDYLLEIKFADEQRKKFQEGHPGRADPLFKEKRYPKYTDKNAIKVFDISGREQASGFDGGIFYLKRNGNLHRASGYEMAPHTRKGHYRTYKNGKTVYVQSSVIHKEKYEGLLSAHRINQEAGIKASEIKEPGEPVMEQQEPEEPENGFTMGMGMQGF